MVWVSRLLVLTRNSPTGCAIALIESSLFPMSKNSMMVSIVNFNWFDSLRPDRCGLRASIVTRIYIRVGTKVRLSLHEDCQKISMQIFTNGTDDANEPLAIPLMECEFGQT
jgi:hypothetical protein